MKQKINGEIMNQLNDKSMCIMCGKGLTSEDGYDLMVCHHVSYFPEIISFVHYLCHRKIHDTMKWEDKQGTMMITNDFIEGKMKTPTTHASCFFFLVS